MPHLRGTTRVNIKRSLIFALTIPMVSSSLPMNSICRHPESMPPSDSRLRLGVAALSVIKRPLLAQPGRKLECLEGGLYDPYRADTGRRGYAAVNCRFRRQADIMAIL